MAPECERAERTFLNGLIYTGRRDAQTPHTHTQWCCATVACILLYLVVHGSWYTLALLANPLKEAATRGCPPRAQPSATPNAMVVFSVESTRETRSGV
jgi:hypothetical protein